MSASHDPVAERMVLACVLTGHPSAAKRFMTLPHDVWWNRLHETCSVCGLAFERRTGDTWFFMYMSTAGLTGLLVVTMFLLRPRVLWIGQLVVCVAAVVLIGLSLPYRKGIAVALDYLIGRGGEEG